MRRVTTLAATLAAFLLTAAGACAAPVTAPSDPSFTAGNVWTGSSACGLLCVTSATQPGGTAVATYSTVLNVLGTAAGSVDFTSASFGWTGASPATATLHYDRKATVANLIAIGGGASATIGLTDVTAAHTTTLKTASFTVNDAAFVPTDVTVPTSLLVAGHTYRLVVHTSFSATVAVAGSSTVAYDNVQLTATRAVPTLSGSVAGTATTTAITLGATVDTAGSDATYHVEYGTTTSYGAVTTDQNVTGSSAAPISTTLSGLTPATTYHARLAVTGDGGTGYGPDVAFTTAALSDPTPPAAPTVGAVSATAAGARALNLSAIVAPNGLTGADYRFEYGTTTAYGSTTAITALPAADGSGWAVASASLTGLTPGTTYHVRAAVRVNGSWTSGADTTVSTAAAVAPSIGAVASSSTSTTAQVGAAITPHSSAVTWHVEYGLTTLYGSSTAGQPIAAGESPVQATADLGGLLPGVSYHFRFVAVSADGTTTGTDQVVVTDINAPLLPSVGTPTVTATGPRSAGAGAQVYLNNSGATDYRFAYGTTLLYGSSTPTTALPPADGAGYATATASISGLAPSTTYHVRTEVLISGLWVPGPDAQVMTPATQAPVVGTPAITTTPTSAHLVASITPGTADVSWRLEYGTTTAYGSSTAPATLTAGGSPQPVTADLSGLTPGTDYHVRFVATGADGTVNGADQVVHATQVPAIGPTTATPGGYGASLLATADPRGLSGTAYRFEYGLTTAYGSATAVTAVPTADLNGPTVVSATLTGLAPGTTYHVRAAIRSGGVWTSGPDTTMTTATTQAPVVGPVTTTPLTTSVTADTTVTPGTANVQFYVEYGTTSAYGATTPRATIPAGGTPARVHATLDGLQPGTTYHLRFVVTGADGTALGDDQVFQTDVDGTTRADGIGGGATTGGGTGDGGGSTTGDQPGGTTTTATPPACRAITLTSRSRGTAVRVSGFVTDASPLAITAPKGAAKVTAVTIDGKAVKPSAVKGRRVLLGASVLATGRHTVRVGTGRKAAKVVIGVGACATKLTVGRGVVTLIPAPGTSQATLTLPATAAKAVARGTLVVRTGSTDRRVKIAGRSAFTTGGSIRVTRTGATLTFSALPANVTSVRLVVARATRLSAGAVRASVVTGTTTARVTARAVTR